jgi:hypothetical protein
MAAFLDDTRPSSKACRMRHRVATAYRSVQAFSKLVLAYRSGGRPGVLADAGGEDFGTDGVDQLPGVRAGED